MRFKFTLYRLVGKISVIVVAARYLYQKHVFVYYACASSKLWLKVKLIVQIWIMCVELYLPNNTPKKTGLYFNTEISFSKWMLIINSIFKLLPSNDDEEYSYIFAAFFVVEFILNAQRNTQYILYMQISNDTPNIRSWTYRFSLIALKVVPILLIPQWNKPVSIEITYIFFHWKKITSWRRPLMP